MHAFALYALCAALLASALLAWALVRCRGRGPSPGSGANQNFLTLDTTPPTFPGLHAKLEHVWRLECEASGRQTWHAVPQPTAAQVAAQHSLTFSAALNPNASDKVHRVQLLAAAPQPLPPLPAAAGGAASAAAGLQRGWDYFARLQQPESGHFAGDYGGPLFLTPCLVIACRVAGVALPPEHCSALLTYLYNHQQSSGGWGLHIEGPAALFSTVLAYAALRCLGVAEDAPAAARARAFVAVHGGAAAAPFWAKFWLALLGAYEWEGVLPLPPELYLLPRWSPFHPGKMWCHSRMVFLPMAYAYGARIGASPSGSGSAAVLAAALRRELGAPAGAAAARAAAWQCSPLDLYTPPTALLRCAMAVAGAWERWAPRWLHARLRAAALAEALACIDAEDAHTGHLCIGPVSKALHLVCVAHGHGQGSQALAQHVAALPDYLWVAEDGMKVQGYNGSQLWDAAFAAQALAAAPSAQAAARPRLAAGLARFLAATQVRQDCASGPRFYRDASEGGWPFSTQRHGWPIVDCTAEALQAVLGMQGGGDALLPVPAPRLAAAARFLLALGPNADGGWATYEQQRGGAWYEWLNSSQVFGDIMVDYSYTELTSAAVCALSAYAGAGAPGGGEALAARARAAAAVGVRYVREQQRADGAWYGSWGVCFLYGTWFGVRALASEAGDAAGLDAPRLAAAAAYVLSAQRSDGGWGETYRSCLTRQAGAATASNAVSTAWALLALMAAGCRDVAAVQRGVACLLRLQEASGDWPQGPCSGIFNRVCGITYSSYRNTFPLWALGVYEREYRGQGGVEGGPSASATAASGGGAARPGGEGGEGARQRALHH